MSRAVSTIDYKALAERIEELAKWVRQYSHRMSDDVADLRTVVTLLDWMAEAEPVAWIKTTHAGVRRLEWNEQTHYANDDYPATTESLFTHPAPQPQAAQTLAPTMPTHDPAMGVSLYQDEEQPERQPVSVPTRSERLREAGFTGRDDRIECDECGKKFTPQMLPIHKCEPTEAQIDYRALYHDLLFAVGNKHAGETRHETALRYIREAERSDGAALAVKESK